MRHKGYLMCMYYIECVLLIRLCSFTNVHSHDLLSQITLTGWRGSITVRPVSSLTELYLTKQENMLLFLYTKTTESKVVKLETNCTMILSPAARAIWLNKLKGGTFRAEQSYHYLEKQPEITSCVATTEVIPFLLRVQKSSQSFQNIFINDVIMLLKMKFFAIKLFYFKSSLA